ncbi:MAG TPA: monovalent cation/H+ antiporter complex subunit F [Azoarcus sp.]|nr:monovalent cation/H+ antiporter complex subunit F [Azoarcus sp.]
MNDVFAIIVGVLLLTLVLGLVRVWRGPNVADRMLAAQLFGSTGVAILLILAELQENPAIRDVALILMLLALLAVLAFVARVWHLKRNAAGPHAREGRR